jgi:hypothetical protein
LDALPPSPPAHTAYVYGPGEIFPRTERERDLCARASHPDWLYLTTLLLLDGVADAFGGVDFVKRSGPYVSFVSPVIIGLTWGATLGGGYLALPKCSPEWVDVAPREGNVHADWPLALALALLSGATAPIVYGIAINVGDLPSDWSTENRALHAVAAGVVGFGGALLPYLVPPATWRAAKEIERIRLGGDGRGGWTLGLRLEF